MKVTKLHIDEYKVFKDFDIEFTDKEGNAQNLIVLAGINGTGKTTLLNALYGNYHYSINDSSKFIHFKGSNDSKVFTDYKIYYDENVILNNYWNELFQYYKAGSHDNKEVIPIINRFIDKCIFELGMRPFESYKELRSFLNHILVEFNLNVEFRSITSEKEPLFRTSYKGNGHGDGAGYGNREGDGTGDGSGNSVSGNKISIEDLSTGERQIISLVIQLLIQGVRNSIILIDEPEFSLHPSWQNKIVGVLQKYADEYNCQVILATHSPHIIGSVKPEQLRLLYKDENGAIKVVENSPSAYGMTFDRVLSEVMGVENLRAPKVEEQLNELHELVKKNEYNSNLFHTKMKEMEHIIGYSDRDLILMRFEVAKRQKQSAANNKI